MSFGEFLSKGLNYSHKRVSQLIGLVPICANCLPNALSTLDISTQLEKAQLHAEFRVNFPTISDIKSQPD